MATNYGYAEGAVRRPKEVESKKTAKKNLSSGKKIQAVPMPKPWEKKKTNKIQQKIKSKKSK